MAEPSLSMKFEDLKAASGLFLGWGRGADKGDRAWTTRQSALLDEFVKGGLRQFYYPPPIDKMGVSYEWSFLRPSATLALAADADSLDLPDDFGGFHGDIALSSDDGGVGQPLGITSVGRVRQLRAQYPDSSGRPQWASVDPKRGTTATHGQRFTLEVYPTADAAYSLLCSYNLHPEALSGTRPFAYGGPAHVETIEASILAVAELKLDDTRGPRYAHFMERLQASVSQDRKMKPQELGYNGDASNLMHSHRDPRSRFRGSVTYNGLAPG